MNMITTVPDGHAIDLDSLEHVFTYDISGNLETDTVSVGGKTYTQTLTWAGSSVVSISQWQEV